MRRFALLCVTTLALTACGQKSAEAPQATTTQPAQTANAAPSAFPDLFQASYRADAAITRHDGSTMPITMVRSGHKVRMEMTTGEGKQVFIMDSDKGESLMIMDRGGRQMAMRSESSSTEDITSQWQGELTQSAHAVGPCSAAGETGTEWERQDQSGDTGSACVTGDGIILRATKNGRTVWETTRVQRGPQDAAQFAAPPGVRVMNLGPGAAAALQRLQGKSH
ncbi:MAG: hypothetical protein ABUS57_13035 [Pseudomonadota bacterium]